MEGGSFIHIRQKPLLQYGHIIPSWPQKLAYLGVHHPPAPSSPHPAEADEGTLRRETLVTHIRIGGVREGRRQGMGPYEATQAQPNTYISQNQLGDLCHCHHMLGLGGKTM